MDFSLSPIGAGAAPSAKEPRAGELGPPPRTERPARRLDSGKRAEKLLRRVAADELHEGYAGMAGRRRRLSESEKNAAELRQSRVQAALERQRATYKGNVQVKRRLMRAMRKYNKVVARNFRDFRAALKDLHKTTGTNPDPRALAGSFQRLVMASRSLTAMMRPMLAMMKQLNQMDQGIGEASRLVSNEDLQADGVGELSAAMQRQIQLRSAGETSADSHLLVGQFDSAWTGQSVATGLELLEQGIDSMTRVVRRQLEKSEGPAPRGVRQQQLMLEAMVREHAALKDVHREITAASGS